jgi:hypothetical protein
MSIGEGICMNGDAEKYAEDVTYHDVACEEFSSLSNSLDRESFTDTDY